MMRLVAVAAVLAVGLLGSPEQVIAQAADTEVVAPADVVATPAQDGMVSGLPQREPPPRTLADYWLVFALLSASWLGIVYYIVRLGRRAKRIETMIGSVDPV